MAHKIKMRRIRCFGFSCKMTKMDIGKVNESQNVGILGGANIQPHFMLPPPPKKKQKKTPFADITISPLSSGCMLNVG